MGGESVLQEVSGGQIGKARRHSMVMAVVMAGWVCVGLCKDRRGGQALGADWLAWSQSSGSQKVGYK